MLETYSIDVPGSAELRTKALTSPELLNAHVLANPIGLLVDSVAGDLAASTKMVGKKFIALVEAQTPLPARRIIEVNVAPGAGGSEVVLQLFEGESSVVSSKRVAVVKPKASLFSRAAAVISSGDADDDDEEEDEDDEVKTVVVEPKGALAHVAVKVDSKVIKALKGVPRLRITIVVEEKEGGKLGGSILAVQLLDGAVESRAEF